MKNIGVFLIVFCLSWTGFYGQDSLVQAPVFPKMKSSLVMPVRIPLAELSTVVNHSVTDLIYEDDSFNDNENDQFKVKVWKTRPIRLVGGTKQNLLVEVPLKIWAQKGIGTLGMYTYQETTFETVMYFSTSVKFNTDWTVATSTQPNGFKWISKPVLDFGMVKIPITPLVEKSLKKEQQKFCETMDRQMDAQLDFRKYAVMAWNSFSQPFRILDDYDTWLKITPVSVSVAPMKIYRDAIDVYFGIQVFSETFTGLAPASSPLVTAVPDLTNVAALSPQFVLQTTANIPYSKARAMAEETFLNREFDFREGAPKVKVTGIDVLQSDHKLEIELRLQGGVNGTAFVNGIPVYDPDKRKIVLSKTRFRLRTSNILQKTASLLFQGKIVRMIENEYGIPTSELEDYARKSVEQAFNKEYFPGMKMKGSVTSLKPSQLLLTASGLTAVIDMTAALQLLVQGM